MSFRKAIDFSLKWEGGYVNDPDDIGRETNFGISKAAHPEVDIANLTRELAEVIYFDDYWTKTGAHFAEVSGADPLEAALMDFAINSGGAIREFQELVGADPDGVIGPATVKAAQRKAYELLAVALCERRKAYLERLIEKNHALSKFRNGWFRRVDALIQGILGGDFS